MEPDVLLDSLITASVLQTEAGEVLTPTAQYSALVAEYRSEEPPAEVTATGAIDTVLKRHDLTAEWRAIESLTDLDEPATLRSLLLLERIARPSPPTAGVPPGFVPVDGDLLDLALLGHERSIAYVWRDDCPPCEAMRAELADLSGEFSGVLGLFAVFGPDWAVHLQDQYGVVGGPTTLFMVGDRVDARLHGAQYRSVIDTEVERLLTPNG